MIHLQSLSDCPFIPWKNNGGITQELLRIGSDPFNFRISVANVTSDGPFSFFPGFLRELVLLEGSLLLKVSGKEKRLNPFQLFSFSGEDSVESQLLNGPVRDFNVIFSKDLKVNIEIIEFTEEPFEIFLEQFLFVSNGEVEYNQKMYSETLFFGNGFLYPRLNSRGILVTVEKKQ